MNIKELTHSFKGTTWDNHKYTGKHTSKNGKTVYEYKTDANKTANSYKAEKDPSIERPVDGYDYATCCVKDDTLHIYLDREKASYGSLIEVETAAEKQMDWKIDIGNYKVHWADDPAKPINGTHFNANKNELNSKVKHSNMGGLFMTPERIAFHHGIQLMRWETGNSLEHSAKGTTWEDHKYKSKHKSKSGKWVYVYDDGTVAEYEGEDSDKHAGDVYDELMDVEYGGAKDTTKGYKTGEQNKEQFEIMRKVGMPENASGYQMTVHTNKDGTQQMAASNRYTITDKGANKDVQKKHKKKEAVNVKW